MVISLNILGRNSSYRIWKYCYVTELSKSIFPMNNKALFYDYTKACQNGKIDQ